MLHTKAQGHWPFGSGEEDFWRVFTIYGRGSHLGHVTQMSRINFRSPDPWRVHMKFGFDWPNGFGEEDLWNGGRTDNGACLYYKLTNEPKGSGELKIATAITHSKKTHIFMSISFNASLSCLVFKLLSYLMETKTVIYHIFHQSFCYLIKCLVLQAPLVCVGETDTMCVYDDN